MAMTVEEFYKKVDDILERHPNLCTVTYLDAMNGPTLGEPISTVSLMMVSLTIKVDDLHKKIDQFQLVMKVPNPDVEPAEPRIEPRVQQAESDDQELSPDEEESPDQEETLVTQLYCEIEVGKILSKTEEFVEKLTPEQLKEAMKAGFKIIETREIRKRNLTAELDGRSRKGEDETKLKREKKNRNSQISKRAVKELKDVMNHLRYFGSLDSFK